MFARPKWAVTDEKLAIKKQNQRSRSSLGTLYFALQVLVLYSLGLGSKGCLN